MIVAHVQAASTARPRDHRNGFVMVLVMITILATTALAAVHQRSLIAALRIEQARMESEREAMGPKTVLATAIERLHTGSPVSSGSSVEYHVDHTSDGSTTTYRVTYTRLDPNWTVSVQPDPSASALPVLPTNL